MTRCLFLARVILIFVYVELILSQDANTSSPGTMSGRCETIQTTSCQGIPYNQTILPNRFFQQTQTEVELEIHQYFPLLQVECSQYLLPFLCAIYLPICLQDGTTLEPCPIMCSKARSGCESLMNGFGFVWPLKLQCKAINDANCLGINGVQLTDIYLRLTGGDGVLYGTVEVSQDNVTWGTVCDDGWDNDAADVVCRMMGFRWGIGYGNAHYGSGSGQILLDDVQCKGDEKSLSQCEHKPWGQSNCEHTEDAGVACFDSTSNLHFAREQPNVGAVQIRGTKGWAEVCHHGWDDKDARVVCRELGYVDGLGTGNSTRAYDPNLEINDAYYEFGCFGNETSLINCTKVRYFSPQCPSISLASAICYNTTADKVNKTYDIRKVDGGDVWGRIEIRHLGVWGSICAFNWSDTNSNVTCQELGYAGGVAFRTYHSPDKLAWVTNVQCDGSEKSLKSCHSNYWWQPIYKCEAASVLCYRKSAPVVNIVGNEMYGRVEIEIDGEVGTICNTYWSKYDARTICRGKGYADGITRPVESGTGKIYLSHMRCTGREQSIFMCNNTGWDVYKGSKCSEQAGVTCQRYVRLVNGTKYLNSTNGILQINHNRKWYMLCSSFSENNARVVCSELGYSNGSVLPRGSFGHYKGFANLAFNCSGNEPNLKSCPQSLPDNCPFLRSFMYVAISCYNGDGSSEFKVELQSDSPDIGYGRVSVKKYNTWGDVCSTSWSDLEANVLCIGLGYTGGKAITYYRSVSQRPILVNEFNCSNARRLEDCQQIEGICYYNKDVAGAVCFRQELRVSLFGGSNYGRVEIDRDGTVGTVCDKIWGNAEARVVCRQLDNNKYVDGVSFNVSAGTGAIYLSDVWCSGIETSLLHCETPGWFAKPNCDHSHDVGVYCYQKVRLFSNTGPQIGKVLSGRLEIWNTNTWSWDSVCADKFSQKEAEVICRELEYDKALILSPGSFGPIKYSRNTIHSVSCKGDEPSFLKCHYNISAGVCSKPTVNYVSLLCAKKDAPINMKVHLDGGYHGKVIVEQYGINGTICLKGWDERDANVTCRSKGFLGGVLLGPPETFTGRQEPVFFSDVDCKGTERSLEDCPKKSDVSFSCVDSLRYAGVLCYKSKGVKLQLVNDDGADYFGRVEISYDGEWGTVCDYDWHAKDANVTCRQLGFPGGKAFKGSTHGNGNGSVYLSGMSCDNTEDTLLECASRGWGNVQNYCTSHHSDASVYCYRPVSLSSEDQYGAVRLWKNNNYGLICADGFDNTDAAVVCRQLGFPSGISLCCSAFGKMKIPIIKTNTQCTGQEGIITGCKSEDGIGRCISGHYASVVCSTSAQPSLDIVLELENGHFGKIMIKYYDHWGYMCSEDYGDKEADVICRQLGYNGGFAYHYTNPMTWRTDTKDIRWLRNLNCTGKENNIFNCGHFELGQIGECSISTYAAAYCFSDKEKVVPDIRLTGSNIPSEGLVEIYFNGTWGSICGWTFTNTEATVLCKQLNYTHGIYVSSHSYGVTQGPLWVRRMTCAGHETSLYQCALSGLGEAETDNIACVGHDFDVGIKCYTNVSLSGTTMSHYGQLQMYNESGWFSVCDQGFDDNDALVACRSMGYKDGRAQCCSALGKWLTPHPIGITNVNCKGTESNLHQCHFEHNECLSRSYVTVACTSVNASITKLAVSLPANQAYGHVEVARYGVIGSICDEGWTDNEASVVCRELGFRSGNATKGTAKRSMPTLVGDVNCTGSETSLDQCDVAPFIHDHNCLTSASRAAVICSREERGVQFRIAEESGGSGRAEIYLNGEWGTICNVYWEDIDANIFCRQLGNYVGGYETTPIPGKLKQEIWVTRVECQGQEENFLQCTSSWDKQQTRYCTHISDAGVSCFKSVRLNRGNYRTNGIVEVYKNKRWGTVCADGFGDEEANFVCNILGYEHGTKLCCKPYGYSFRSPLIGKLKCNGTEKHVTDCYNGDPQCSSQGYASVSCYNGVKSTAYSLSLIGKSNTVGQVNLTYQGVEGGICTDGWNDKAAKVVCGELGYPNGIAYKHYKSALVFFEYNGPYWTSQVNCTGNEMKLSECKHVPFGKVESCENRHYAGVLCYTTQGLAFRMEGGNEQYGRVQASVHGIWGSLCDNYWDNKDADVFCRQMGYNTGEAYYGKYKTDNYGTIWEVNLRCLGDEDNLNMCIHEGWKNVTSMQCMNHKDSAGVFCYSNVKLSKGIGGSSNNGAVLLYKNRNWYRVCDQGFTDMSARVVCQELGYVDGRAICCSAYGKTRNIILNNYTISCTGREKSVDECIRQETCNSTSYASVVCFTSQQIDNLPQNEEENTTINLTERSKGQVIVNAYGVEGRICSVNETGLWTDNDAKVVCYMRGYTNGIAYLHDEDTTLEALRGPFWMSGFNCTGNETSLSQCPHQDRLSLGNCARSHIASALCYNGSAGITYDLVGGQSHYGRVEVTVNGITGTICDAYWDNTDASVLCRQKGFSEGVALGGAAYGQGTGPLWLSHIRCNGTEKYLHQCPHRGFNDEFSNTNWFLPIICSSHRDDASVFCYKSVRLNEGHDAKMGGVEFYKDGKWYGVCDSGFDNKAAKVICKSLGLDYIDGKSILGSAFGNISGVINVTNVVCSGNETDFTECTYQFGKPCPSKMYASVYCSSEKLKKLPFDVRISPDSLSSYMHGIVEARIDGVWGRVCMADWDDADASVACRHIGYAGGVAYLHIMKNRKPMLMRGIKCKGTEKRLDDCPHHITPDLQNCTFNSNDAGVLCYNKTGIRYRLNNGGNENSSVGRVEIGYDNKWGTVCSWSWQSADAQVLCRQLNYTDGIVDYNITNKDVLPRWVTGFFCQGSEKTLMTCLNTGFNSSFLDDLCVYDKEPGAYTACYNEKVELKNVTLKGGTEYAGRVEVFVSGPNQWGTVCDDFWDDAAASVVCRQLGFGGGKARKEGVFGKGNGPIWLDNVRCFGNESSLFECSHRGIGTHNCNHTEDVGVTCTGPVISTESPFIKTTTTSTTTTTTLSMTTTTTTEPTSTTKTTQKTMTSEHPVKPSTDSSTTTTTTTTKQTTTTTTSTPSPATTKTSTTTLTTTTVSMTTKSNMTIIPKERRSEPSSNLALIVAIPIVIFIIIIVILALVFFFKMRKLNKEGIPHERFHDDIIEHQHDGSISMSNQLYDMSMQPTANGYSADNSGDKLRLAKNGTAHYSKPGVNSNSFANPLYGQVRDPNPGEALPEQNEITLPDYTTAESQT